MSLKSSVHTGLPLQVIQCRAAACMRPRPEQTALGCAKLHSTSACLTLVCRVRV